jgi:hypothetical protein
MSRSVRHEDDQEESLSANIDSHKQLFGRDKELCIASSRLFNNQYLLYRINLEGAQIFESEVLFGRNALDLRSFRSSYHSNLLYSTDMRY